MTKKFETSDDEKPIRLNVGGEIRSLSLVHVLFTAQSKKSKTTGNWIESWKYSAAYIERDLAHMDGVRFVWNNPYRRYMVQPMELKR